MNPVSRLLAAAGLVAALPLGAQQQRPVPSVFNVTPYVGYMVFGRLIDGPIGIDLSSSSGAIYGAQAALDVAPNVALVGNVGFANSDLRIGVPILGGVDVGSNRVMVYDANLHLSVPLDTRGRAAISPFIQGGVGGMRSEIDNSLIDASSTSIAFNIGGGIDYPISRSIGLRLMAKDYISKFDFQEATSIDYEGRTAHNWAFSGGVKISF